jgi:hypothetical protein
LVIMSSTDEAGAALSSAILMDMTIFSQKRGYFG